MISMDFDQTNVDFILDLTVTYSQKNIPWFTMF